MTDSVKVADVIPAAPRAVYEAWLDSRKHALMTGAATSDEGGGRFTAWDGYISGRTLSATPFTKIVQAWRTSHFAADAPDSMVTVELEPFDGGTHVTLVHENIPEEQGDSYRDGWHQFYFAPMKVYFASLSRGVRGAKSKPKKVAAKKAAPKKVAAKKSPAKKKKAAPKKKSVSGKKRR